MTCTPIPVPPVFPGGFLATMRGMVMTEAKWVRAFPVNEVAVGATKLFRHASQQVAVFRLGAETFYAVDNRCPHEGYPLLQGQVKECVLTCAWHNFKFDLRDGRCVLGGEDVRTFPVRIVGADVEVDVAEPEPQAELSRLWESLEAALWNRRLGQASRDVARLLHRGVTPEDLALACMRFDAKYAELGSTHALPLAIDALAYTDRHHGVAAVLPLMQAFELAADAHVRMPERARVDAVDPGEDAVAAGARLRRLVEAEDTAAAEALLRGALARGFGRAEIEPWFLDLCADHFLSLGHPLIYTIKVFDFLDASSFGYADAILPALLYRICRSTREDTLPPWNAFRARLAETEPKFAALFALQSERVPREWDRDSFLTYVLDGTDGEAFAAITGSLSAGVPLETLMDLLVIAASERVGRFDVAHDANVEVQDGWLFVTHILTYGHAVRLAVQRHRDARALRHVYYLGRFINQAKALDLPPEGRGLLAKIRIKETLHDCLVQIADFIRRKETPEAVSLVLKFVARKRPIEKLRAMFLDLALEDSAATRPIIVAHLIKTAIVAFDEFDRLEGDPMQTHPLLALTRLFASRVVERSTARRCFEASGFVEYGRVPRVLLLRPPGRR